VDLSASGFDHIWMGFVNAEGSSTAGGRRDIRPLGDTGSGGGAVGRLRRRRGRTFTS
jgi:hypothetical protein